MNWTLEVVVVPVADLDRAKDFYADKLGFNVDHDTKISELTDHGVAVSEIQVLGENPRPVPNPMDNVGFFFTDPDGNGWAVQQISSRG